MSLKLHLGGGEPTLEPTIHRQSRGFKSNTLTHFNGRVQFSSAKSISSGELATKCLSPKKFERLLSESIIFGSHFGLSISVSDFRRPPQTQTHHHESLNTLKRPREIHSVE